MLSPEYLQLGHLSPLQPLVVGREYRYSLLWYRLQNITVRQLVPLHPAVMGQVTRFTCVFTIRPSSSSPSSSSETGSGSTLYLQFGPYSCRSSWTNISRDTTSVFFYPTFPHNPATIIIVIVIVRSDIAIKNRISIWHYVRTTSTGNTKVLLFCKAPCFKSSTSSSSPPEEVQLGVALVEVQEISVSPPLIKALFLLLHQQ